jgi:hypothetical protein
MSANNDPEQDIAVPVNTETKITDEPVSGAATDRANADEAASVRPSVMFGESDLGPDPASGSNTPGGGEVF